LVHGRESGAWGGWPPGSAAAQAHERCCVPPFAWAAPNTCVTTCAPVTAGRTA